MTEVVAALIRENGRFLICRRPEDKARALLWEFPGGKVEQGETGEEALERECAEELGVILEVGEIYSAVTHRYPDLQVHLMLYHARIMTGRPRRLEHAALRWVTPAELSGYDFCPADREIIQKLEQDHSASSRSAEFSR